MSYTWLNEGRAVAHKRRREALLGSAAVEPTPDPVPDLPAVVSVEMGGYQAWCDGYRSSGGCLTYLSIFGVQSNVRALWARMVGSSRSHNYLGVQGDFLRCEDGVRYLSFRSVLSKQMAHIVILHPDATAKVSPFSGRFDLVSLDPVAQYWERFTRMCCVPFRDSWRERVWELGLAAGLIEPMQGFGPFSGYTISTGAEWEGVMEKAIQAGELA